MPFFQSQLDDELGAIAVGKELLGHELASDDRENECGRGDADDQPAPLDGGIDQAAQPVVERRLVRVAAAMAVLREIRQHLHGEIGRDQPGHEPREHHGGADDPENAPAYSPVVDFENPIGMKAAAVMSAPVSRGIAVDV